MRAIRAVVASAALALSAQSGATVLFSENFDSITSNTLQITTSVGGMTVTGAVDAVVPMNPFGIAGLTSTVVDLDGSPGPGRVSAGGFNLQPGFIYTLSLVVGGAQRGSVSDNWSLELTSDAPGVLNSLGGTGLLAVVPASPLSSTFMFSGTVLGTTPFTASSIALLANSNTSFGFEIGTTSRDAVGPLLDSVTLTRNAVPEPASWAMLIAGFGLVGAVARRRKVALAA
jgi:hypothetical protein